MSESPPDPGVGVDQTGPGQAGFDQSVRRPRRRRRGRVLLATVLVVGGLAAGAAAVVLDHRPPDATVDPSTQRVATPVLSARRVPEWTTRPLANRRLVEAVGPVVATAPPQTCVGIGDGARSWYAHNPTAPLVPASNMKLLTGAAVLELIGADTTLDTVVRTDAPPADGVVAGNLYVIGGGDPLLTSEGRQVGRETRVPETDLEAVADQLVAAGVRRIDGSVVGDGTRYDGQLKVPTWPQRHLTGGTSAPLSALLVNDGWLVDPTTGQGPGGPAPDPPAHAAAVLTQLLVARGVVVAGPPVSGTAPATGTDVLVVPSKPVSELVAEVLTYSDNTAAELLVKEIGVRVKGEGSTAAGTAAITEWATAQGLPVGGMVVLDGSGLSYENRLTCDLLAAVLRRDGSQGPLSAGLAVPGSPGTLQDRFAGGDWAARLRAKTGTLNTVTSLSGWLASRPGTNFEFQILENTGERGTTKADTAFQQRLLEVLLDHPVAPPLAEAGPAPPTAVG